MQWQSIEILLGPEEHVPFMQNAVKFGIKNPDTGETFPVDLPTEAFPLVPDKEVEAWHAECAEKLRKKATPTEEEIRPDLPPRPRAQATYAHVRPTQRSRQNTDDPRMREDSPYFESSRNPASAARPLYAHVSSRPVRPGLSHSPSHRARQFLAPEDEMSPRMARARRKSYPDNMHSPGASPTGAPPVVVPPESRPRPADHARRHSHPRQARRGSMSSDASSSSEGESPTKSKPPKTTSRMRSGTQSSPTDGIPSGVRYTAPPVIPEPRPRTRERGHLRDDEEKRRSYPVPIDTNGKLSAPFLLQRRDRERVHRSRSRNGHLSWKDLDGAAAEELWRRVSTEEDERPRGSKERERGDRDVYKRREREKERDMRPKLAARQSSHEDSFRRPRSVSDRERGRDRVYAGENGDRRSYKDRAVERERRAQSPIRGVDGRRYPAH